MNRKYTLLKSIESKLDESTQLMKKRKLAAYAAEDEDFDDTNTRAEKHYALGESKDVPGLPKIKKFVNKQDALQGRNNKESAQFSKEDFGPTDLVNKSYGDDSYEEYAQYASDLQNFYQKSYEDMHKHADDWINANDSIQKKYAKKFKPFVTKGF